MRLVYRLQGLYREIVCALKPFLRATKREASLVRFRLRRWRGGQDEVRVVCVRAAESARRLPHPAITLETVGAASGSDAAAAGAAQRGLVSALAGQTERSVTGEQNGAYLFTAEGNLGGLAATHLESMLLAAAALDLELVLAGEAPPALDRFGPSGPVFARPGGEAAAKLVRLRSGGRAPRPIVGRIVPHLSEIGAMGDPCDAGDGKEAEAGTQSPTVVEERLAAAPVDPGLPTAGPWIFSFAARSRGVVRQPVYELHEALRELPVISVGGVDGAKRTVLYLLPYLAVGGAEKLLFELIRGLDGVRTLIVTLEPHQTALGQTVDRARELTPHVYTLGDWLPREAHGGAIRHLLRRYGVETVMSWNGTTWFYDEAPALRRAFPALRLVNQLYNHRGGWIEHYRPSLVHALDCHVAVNRRIARALEARGVPAERVRLVYHGVQVPELPSEEERQRRRDERRRELGLPLDALVVGTFVRMHGQKRPLDVVRLARRFRGRGVAFLLAGSGPLDAALEREIAADPPPNLVRLPMRRDPEHLYDAIDLCLLTSSFEGLPVFLLEGLARGIPCVATAVGEVSMLLEEGGGVVVERPGDLNRLVEAIESMRPADRRCSEGERGRRTVRHRFGVQAYCAAYLEEVLGSNG